MPAIAIDEKKLWLATLKKSGVAIRDDDFGGWWIDADTFWEFLNKGKTNAAAERIVPSNGIEKHFRT